MPSKPAAETADTDSCASSAACFMVEATVLPASFGCSSTSCSSASIVGTIGMAKAEAAALSPSPPASSRKEQQQNRMKALKIWRSFASMRLAEMATSLDAALANDGKLRSLFDRRHDADCADPL